MQTGDHLTHDTIGFTHRFSHNIVFNKMRLKTNYDWKLSFNHFSHKNYKILNMFCYIFLYHIKESFYKLCKTIKNWNFIFHLLDLILHRFVLIFNNFVVCCCLHIAYLFFNQIIPDLINNFTSFWLYCIWTKFLYGCLCLDHILYK